MVPVDFDERHRFSTKVENKEEWAEFLTHCHVPGWYANEWGCTTINVYKLIERYKIKFVPDKRSQNYRNGKEINLYYEGDMEERLLNFTEERFDKSTQQEKIIVKVIGRNPVLLNRIERILEQAKSGEAK